jgi:hypothetical protein
LITARGGKILIELKRLLHLAQAINYTKAFELEVGLLINFGATSLQFRRLQNKHKHPIKDHPSKMSELGFMRLGDVILIDNRSWRNIRYPHQRPSTNQ